MEYITKTIFPNTMTQILSVKQKKITDILSNCPNCKKDTVETFSSNVKCTSCHLNLSYSFFGKTLDTKQMSSILDGNMILIKGLKGKKAKKFDASVIYSKEDNRLDLVFKETLKKETKHKCPVCNKSLVERDKFFGCDGYTKGCKFSLPKSKGGHIFNNDEIETLLSGKKTSSIDFISFKTKKPYIARLIIENGKIVSQFE